MNAIIAPASGDWAVWLRGERWTAATEHSDIKITAVSPHEIRATISGHDIALQPHQCYRKSSGTISEGD